MATSDRSITRPAVQETEAFARMGARRLLALAGIGMILVGMLFGDIFAVFILHQNAGRVGASLQAAAIAAAAGDATAVSSNFKSTGEFLENRGTKVDTHVHLIAFGYLALMLALVQPWVMMSDIVRRRLASLFIFGAIVLPVGVFLIHYVGLAYSPLSAIGWASIFADAGGLFVLLSTAGYLFGLYKCLRNGNWQHIEDGLLRRFSPSGRILMAGGVLLVVAGFAQGAYYAGSDLPRHESADYNILLGMSSAAGAQDVPAVNQALQSYGQLQADKAVKIAAHAHFVEFGFLAMILAFFQPYVSLRELWKRKWAQILLGGSTLLPLCVLLELRFGLLAGGLADFGGLLVIAALLAMWIGILRYTGALDVEAGTA